MNQSVSIIYLTNKARELMSIANEFREEDVNLFLDLVSIYTAMCSSIDMVEEVQDTIYNQAIEIDRLKEDLIKLTDRL